MTTIVALLGLVLAGVAGGSAPAADSSRHEREAAVHYLKALDCLERNTLDYRRQGLRELDEAVRLAPENATYRLARANLQFFGGYYHAARRDYEQLAAADSADAYLDLGLLWRRDWLASNDRRSLDRAADAIMTAAWLVPTRADAWLLLVPLYLEQDKREEAASAAFSALEADPERLEAHLAVAATLCHLGVVALGDSIFRATIPRLPMGLRARLERAAPLPRDQASASIFVAAAGDPAAAGGRGSEEAERTLKPEVEERLWVWSHLTEEYLLLPAAERNAERPAAGFLSETGPPFVARYGPMAHHFDRVGGGAGDAQARGTIWESPELGLRMQVLDRLLACRPLLPDSRIGDGAAPPRGTLAVLYARVLAALGAAQPGGGSPGGSGSAVPGK
jgi:Tfp pilus assembly protein PilF